MAIITLSLEQTSLCPTGCLVLWIMWWLRWAAQSDLIGFETTEHQSTGAIMTWRINTFLSSKLQKKCFPTYEDSRHLVCSFLAQCFIYCFILSNTRPCCNHSVSSLSETNSFPIFPFKVNFSDWLPLFNSVDWQVGGVSLLTARAVWLKSWY